MANRPSRRRHAAKRQAYNRQLFFESLEGRRLLATDFRNPVDSLDIDADGTIVPLDALWIINELNAVGSHDLVLPRDPAARFVDPSGDQLVAPLDAVLVINYLNDRGSGPRILRERGQLSDETLVTVTVGQPTGSRFYRVEIDATFDTSDVQATVEDLIAVYVVNPQNPSQTLLDRGVAGTALFSLSGGRAEYKPGLARWDGAVLEIDTTQLRNLDTAWLRFQLLSNDTDSGSQVLIRPISNETGPLRSSVSAFDDSTDTFPAGAAVNLATLGPAADVVPNIENIRFDSASGRYAAEVSLQNHGLAFGREIVAVFPGLPSGVTLVSPSGTTASGDPYVNLRPSIASGGLQPGMSSGRTFIEFDNPNQSLFPFQPRLFASANHPPTLTAIPDITTSPGSVFPVRFHATDLDGDTLRFAVAPAVDFPNSSLDAAGNFTIRPTPAQLGTYSFDVSVTDGALSASQTVVLNVVADPVNSIRISGRVLEVNGQPIPNMMVEIGAVQGLTSVDGTFLLDLGNGPLVSDTLRIRGDLYPGSVRFPFIAEKLPLVLQHDVYPAANNTIERPIYLPALDLANGKVIDPAQDITVTTSAIPGVAVSVAAGTLMNQQGTPFNGVLSITEVPPDLTPAALPKNLIPGLVVTIQPGEMVFAKPAPITFPNRMSYAPGVILDLWSINPVTGQFDDVGDMRVSADGTIIETISGGIRNSSWHFPTPPPPPPNDPDDTPQNQDDNCDCSGGGGGGGGGSPPGPPPGAPPPPGNENNSTCNDGGGGGGGGGGKGGGGTGGASGGGGCADTAPGGSSIELHSGALREWHELVPYFSFGQSRSWTLNYNSERASPSATVYAGYDNVVATPITRLVAGLKVDRGNVSVQSAGNPAGQFGLPGGEHFWTITQSGSVIAGIHQDLSDFPTGTYQVTLTSGIMNFVRNRFFGSTTDQTTTITIVNGVDSIFGAGWGLGGLLQFVENPDGSLLLVNGNGKQTRFGPVDGTQFAPPPGDFSTVSKLANGEFERILKDQTTQRFDRFGFLTSVTDRLGNQTSFAYSAPGRLSTVTDPVGLITSFLYTGQFVSEIVDPAGRHTTLTHDTAGNLIRVTDPDGTSRSWSYDPKHLMTGEVDKRGFSEKIEYDQWGRVTKTTIGDGSVRFFEPVQSQGVADGNRSLDPNSALRPLSLPKATASFTDGNGNVRQSDVNALGQTLASNDAVGLRTTVKRNSDNLVEQVTDGRGNLTKITYDDRGNVIRVEDSITGFSLTPTVSWIGTGNGQWNDPANWSTGRVPQPSDIVAIERDNAQLTITISGASPVVSGITSTESLVVDNATLTVTGLSQIQGSLTLQNNARLTVSDAAFILSGSATINNSQLTLTDGALARLDGPSTASNSQFLAIGGSRLVANGMTKADGSRFVANTAGTISMPALASFQGPTSLGISEQRILFQAIGIGSRIDAPALTSVIASFTGLGAPRAIVEATQGGTVNLSSLQTLTAGGGGPFEFRQTGGTIDLSKLTTITGTSVGVQFTIRDASYSLPRLTTATRATFSMPNGGRMDLPLLTRLQNSTVNATQSTVFDAPALTEFLASSLVFAGGSQFNTGTLTSIDESSFALSGGATLALPSGITSYQGPSLGIGEQRTIFSVRDSGTMLDLSSLTSINASYGNLGAPRAIVEATQGGTVNLSSLQTLTAGGGGPFEFRQTGGTIDLSKLTTITGTSVGVQFTIRDASYSLPRLTTATRATFSMPNGGRMDLPLLTRLQNSTVNATQSTVFDAPALTEFLASSLVFAGGSQFNTGTLTSIDESSFALSGGATLALPSGITSYQGPSLGIGEQRTIFSTRDSGTMLDLSSLTSISASYGNLGAPRAIVEATQGGTINLSGLKTLTGGGGAPLEIRQTGGTIDLSSLDTITGTSVGVQFTITSSPFALPELTTATRTKFAIGPGVQLTAPKLSTLTNGSIDLADNAIAELNHVLSTTLTGSTVTTGPGSELRLFQLGLGAGAQLGGFGSVVGSVSNAGTIDPGSTQPGRLTITGDLVQASTGTIRVNINGPLAATDFDQLSVLANSSLADQLNVSTATSYSPPIDQVFSIIVTATNTGQFATATGLTLPNGKRLDVVYTANGVDLRTLADGGEGLGPEPAEPQSTIGDTAVPDWRTGEFMTYELPYGPLEADALLAESEGPEGEVQAFPKEFSYDPTYNRLTRVRDENGHLTLFDIESANGNLLSRRDIVGVVDDLTNGQTDDIATHYTYTAQGLIDTATDPLGRITDLDYDFLGRMITLTVAKGTADEATTRYEYDIAGNVSAIVDANGNRTEFQFDLMNRPIRITQADPDGSGPLLSPITTLAYDAAGNLTSTTNALNQMSTFEYDALNRMVKSIASDPDGPGPLSPPVVEFLYDANGNVVQVIDPLGKTTTNVHDARNRVVETIDPGGGRVRFAYDFDNNLVALTDPVGNTTQFVYDARSRTIRETDPLGKSIAYSYDPVNNLTEETDRNGRITQFAYDDLDRPILETWVGGNNQIEYTYDDVDNLLSVRDQFSSLAWTYDSRDRATSEDNLGTPGAPHVVLAYAYDDVGNVLTVTDTINGTPGATNATSYDGLNRVSQMTQQGAGLSAKRVDYLYNELGQTTSIRRFSDLAGLQPVAATSYEFDSMSRLRLISHTNPVGDVLESFGYSYDSASRITQIIEPTQISDYAYDVRDQLIAADYGDPTRTDESFTFDANGNRVQSNAHGNSYRIGPANRLLTDGVFDYQYDDEGNLSKRTEIATGNTREFQWDHRNRLTMLTDKNADGTLKQVVRFSYDALGRRISKSTDTTPTDALDAAIEQYVYDGDDVILDFVDPDGSDPAASQQTVRYLRGPGVDNLLAIEEGAGTNWVLKDHLGSTRALVSSAGVLVQTIDYDSFGRAIVNGSPLTRYLYTGREFDSESGLFYYRARYYDSSTGRFTNEDPLRVVFGDSNLFQYVDNTPTMYNDPTGLIKARDIITIISLLVGLAGNFDDNQIPPNAPSNQQQAMPSEPASPNPWGNEGDPLPESPQPKRPQQCPVPEGRKPPSSPPIAPTQSKPIPWYRLIPRFPPIFLPIDPYWLNPLDPPDTA